MCECGMHTEEADAPSSIVRTSRARLSELWMECSGERCGGEAAVPFVLWGVGAVILQCIIHFYELAITWKLFLLFTFLMVKIAAVILCQVAT